MDDIIELLSGSDEEPSAKKPRLLRLSLSPTDIVDVSDDEQTEEKKGTPEAETSKTVSDKLVQIKNNSDTPIDKREDVKTNGALGLSFKIEIHKEPKPNQQACESTNEQDNCDPPLSDAGDDPNNLLQVLREEPLEEDIVRNANNQRVEDASEAGTSYTSIATTSRDKSPALPDELNAFLAFCLDTLSHKTLHKKVRSVKTAARQASEYIKTREFIEALESYQEAAFKDPSTTAYSFVKLYKLLKEHENRPDEDGQVAGAKDAKRMEQLDDLYEKLQKVQARIEQYGSAEVDFDEEESSAFIKYDKYMEKAKEIVDAIAKLQEHSPYSGLQYFSRLDFAGSKYQQFNVALNRKYRNREKDEFPSFYDVNKLLRRCAEKNNLVISEPHLKTEIESCFKSLGKLLKKRRQKDLECVHTYYLKDHKDPAKDDPELERRLRENKKARKSVEDVFNKYSGMQDTGVEPELSADSDDSARRSDEDESDASDE